MQEHDVEDRDRLEVAFSSKDTEATLIVPIVKSSRDYSIDIVLSPKKKADHSQSFTHSVSIYFPGRIASNVFSDLTFSVTQRFQQQLKRFTPKTEDDIIKIWQEDEKIYRTLSSFQAYHLGLKNTIEVYLNKVG